MAAARVRLGWPGLARPNGGEEQMPYCSWLVDATGAEERSPQFSRALWPDAQTKAAWPVIARPTIRDWTVSVPS
jgi:hypothetical protein